MVKIDKKIKLELTNLLGTIITMPKKDVRIISDGEQFRIRIPKLFTNMLKIDTNKDHFEFSLDRKDGEWEMKGILKRK